MPLIMLFSSGFKKNIHQQILRGEIMRHNSQDTTQHERFKPKTICLINCKHWASVDCEATALWAQTHQTSSHTCQQGERGGIFQNSKQDNQKHIATDRSRKQLRESQFEIETVLGLDRSRYKEHFVRIRKRSCVGLKCSVSTNMAEKCSDILSKTSKGFTVSNSHLRHITIHPAVWH